MTSDTSPTPLGRPGAYSKGVARRQEILDRAIEVFHERGADGASLRAIAKSLGVSHAALLHYFDSREQLLVAVYEHAESARDVDPEIDESTSAVEVLAHAAQLNLDVPGIVQLYATLVATALQTETGPAREFFSDRFVRVRGVLAARLRREQEDGRVRRDVDADDMAALLVAASDGLQIQWLLEPSVELDRTLRTLAVVLAPPSA